MIFFPPSGINLRKLYICSDLVKGHQFIMLFKRWSIFVIWSIHLIFFFHKKHRNFSGDKTKILSYYLWSKVKLVNSIITFRKLGWIHHDKTMKRKSLIKSGRYNKLTWKLQTGHSKNFFKTVAIQRFQWQCSGIHGDFTIMTFFCNSCQFDPGPIFTFLLLPLWKMTWEPNPDSPTRSPPFYSQMKLV